MYVLYMYDCIDIYIQVYIYYIHILMWVHSLHILVP